MTRNSVRYKNVMTLCCESMFEEDIYSNPNQESFKIHSSKTDIMEKRSRQTHNYTWKFQYSFC